MEENISQHPHRCGNHKYTKKSARIATSKKNMKAHMAYKFPSLDNDGSKEQHKKRKNKYPTKKIKITKKN